MKCSNCGTENNDGVKFCKKCGTSLISAEENNTRNTSEAYTYNPASIKKKSSKKWIWIILAVLVLIIAASFTVFFTVFDGSIDNLPFIGESNVAIEETTTPTSSATETTAETTESVVQTKVQVAVPDLAGLSVDDAKDKLEDVGLKYDIIYTESQSVQEDYVISQSPISGRNADKDETVTLYVSEGHTENTTAVSDDVYSTPEFEYSFASSTLAPEGEFHYDVDNLRYNDDTCWCEGVSGKGKDEYVMLSSDTLQRVSGISIVNGYSKDNTVYYNNCRVKKLKFEFSDGSTITKSISDTMDLQTVSFGKTINTYFIKISIMDIYSGNVYEDTCVSFISPY